ncbi:MAG: hypothetical protein WCB02_38735, partial [Bradyrhizobium sp.]
APVEPPPAPPMPRPTAQSDVRAEIQARIASFRAHQERFNRERAEYFNTTLARLRATIDGVPAREPATLAPRPISRRSSPLAATGPSGDHPASRQPEHGPVRS